MLTSDELHSRFDRMKEAGLQHYIVEACEALRTGALPCSEADGRSHVDQSQSNTARNPGSPMSKRRREFFCAEDNPGNRMLVKAYLKGNPFEIDEAENGAVAVNKFTSRKYDLVLMDMYMPVVGRLRGHRRDSQMGARE